MAAISPSQLLNVGAPHMPDTEFKPAISSAADWLPDGMHRTREPRRKTYLLGLLVHSDGAFTSDCVVRNFSEGGAGITLAKRQMLPADFYLIVVKYALACHAKVAWLDFPARGLRFTDKHILTESSPRELLYLRQLWLDLSVRSGGIPHVEQWNAEQRAARCGSAF
jgi:hypothetical protein